MDQAPTAPFVTGGGSLPAARVALTTTAAYIILAYISSADIDNNRS
jgi:hypothetical protein